MIRDLDGHRRRVLTRERRWADPVSDQPGRFPTLRRGLLSGSYRRRHGNVTAFWFTARPLLTPPARLAESPVRTGVSALGGPPDALSVLKPNLGVRGQPPRLLSPHRRQPSQTLALSG